MADSPVLTEMEINCPSCGAVRVLDQEDLESLIVELESWDRRYDSPKTAIEGLIAVLEMRPGVSP